MTLEDSWHRIIEDAYAKTGPPAIAALVAELDRRGDLRDHDDRLVAAVMDEIRSERPTGKLGHAVALIEAGDAKDAVIAAGVSRRTYFRARRESAKSAKPIRTAA